MDYESVMAEKNDWISLQSKVEEERLDVYLDLKSPHAYLAVRPSLEIARDFRVSVNFLPYTLSYMNLGVTTEVGIDKKRIPASPLADRKAKMYYAAAREYAKLQSLPFLTPFRLLDSELGHRAFLFAKSQGLEIPFAMCVYLKGWGSGLHDFELESLKDLASACEIVGVEMSGFYEFLADGGEGQLKLRETEEKAESEGLVGVPHYVFLDRDKYRRVGLFGREHLALIRSKYLKLGLARNALVRGDFSHTWPL